MFKRLLPIALTGLLFAQPAMTQAPRDGADGQAQYRLTGVMVSDTRRTALLNGRVVHEGASVGGALIESIDQRQIRVRIGAQQQIVRVGHSFVARPAQEASDGLVVTRSKPDARSVAASVTVETPPPDEETTYTVVDGDTLSGIALHHRPDGATMNQVMIALFEANPDAFDGNLNRLRAGATLRVPDSHAMQRLEPAFASAQVLDHHQQWRGVAERPVLTASNPPTQDQGGPATPNPADTTLGPVTYGDTLSAIAEAISARKIDISTAQVMVALYEANPHAFGPSMNTLFEGAVLRLPGDERLAARSDAAATLEVQRQVAAWGHDPPDRPVDEPYHNLATIASVGGLPTAGNHPLLRRDAPH